MWANKMYPEINGKAEEIDKETKNEIYKNVKAISIHKIGSAVVFSTDNLLISKLLGLEILGAYTNYVLIISTLTTLFVLLSNAIRGSVGNLIASTSKEYVYSRYKLVSFLFSVLSTFCTVCMFVLFQPFISVWTNGNPIYLLNFSTVILICISFYLGRMRISAGMFKECAGLFYEDRWKPIVESVVNLIVSIVLGIYMGIDGIIIGTIISTVVAPLWVEPWVLYKNYFNKPVREYFKTYIRDVVIMVLIAAICYFACSLLPAGGLLWLIIRFAVCITVCGGLLIVMYDPTKEFKLIFNGIKDKIIAIKSKK
jgi:O-antigen/teichoic acid export membrane protein